MDRWKVLKSQELYSSGVIHLRVDECELPDKRVMPKYYVLDFPDWVNVVPVTPNGDILLVEQYRHAAGETFVELPGGSTHKRGEDPRVAGARELREETGYEAREWINCGFHFPNPALQSNKMHTFIALDCVRVGEPELDPFEDLRLVKMPLREAFEKWQRGEFLHSIIAASFGYSWRILRERGLL